MRYQNFTISNSKIYKQILKIILKEKFNIIRYISVSIISYIYVLSLLYILVSKFNFEKLISYIFVYISVYFIEYILTLIFVFNKSHSTRKLFRFIIYVILFLLISSILYKFLLEIRLNYLIAAILVAVMLMPIRYFFNKIWVYK